MAKVDSKPNQNERILAYIKKHGSITQFEAMNQLGVMRLASRVSDMRSKGIPIASRLEEIENRFGEKCRIKRYFLLKGEEDEEGTNE